MGIRRLLLMVCLFFCIALTGIPSFAQGNGQLTMQVDTGFDNFYRSGEWLPLQIHVQNDGASITGRLTVRPETSGRAVNSAYSLPIELPTGSDKTVFLYVQAQRPAISLIVELIDDEGVRAKEQVVTIIGVRPQDSLNMVISGTGARSIPLNTLAQVGYTSNQGRWEVDNLPPDVTVFEAIDTLFLYDVQSDTFTIDQLQAIEAWVAIGGHLVIVGGPAWTQTTSALPENLLPFLATGNENIDNITAMADSIGVADTLEARTFITTGEVINNGQVLIETDEGLPLLIRREFGLGNVDFLTVDPTLEPLRSWTHLQDFWFATVSSIAPEPGWQRGFLDLQDAARALAILPGVELLPPVSSMILFIVAYILLIGPVNYILLSRLNRRAWAWATIPLFILAFTLLAWNTGFNLRGNEIILSRLYIVQSFPDTDIAYQQGLVGVLSPRREIYTINAPEDTVLGTFPGVNTESIFSANVSQSTANISQGQNFYVEDVAIDGGIFANFSLNRIVTAPNISGSATIAYLPDERPSDAISSLATPQSIRGFVRNDSDMRLTHVVILARNRFYRVDGIFEPGDVLDFDTEDFDYINNTVSSLIPIASPIQSSSEYFLDDIFSNRRGISESLVTSRVLLNLDWTTSTQRNDLLLQELNDEELSRRRALLRSFIRDQHSTSGIGNQVYVFAWTQEQQPDDLTIVDVTYRPVDTTLHIIELESDVELPAPSETITLSADQFTWTANDMAEGQVSGNFNDLLLINPGWAEYSVTPINGAILEDVSSIIVEMGRRATSGQPIEVLLWNQDSSEWDLLENNRLQRYIIDNPAPYLGVNNQMKIRFEVENNATIGSPTNGHLLDIRLIQSGNF